MRTKHCVTVQRYCSLCMRDRREPLPVHEHAVKYVKSQKSYLDVQNVYIENNIGLVWTIMRNKRAFTQTTPHVHLVLDSSSYMSPTCCRFLLPSHENSRDSQQALPKRAQHSYSAPTHKISAFFGQPFTENVQWTYCVLCC